MVSWTLDRLLVACHGPVAATQMYDNCTKRRDLSCCCSTFQVRKFR
jgi:hypothetical protein